MVDGGQKITSFEAHLQTGSELFDTDPKGALAAYYQAVSIEPSHIEGWNQIGRLMFDLQQYSEAEMVFQRVEQLATEQGLADWAEMAAQNIDLTRQTLAEQNRPAAAQEPVEQEFAVQGEAEPETGPGTGADDVIAGEMPPSVQEEPFSQGDEDLLDEQFKSIEDIGNIAEVAEIPERDSLVTEEPEIQVAVAAPAPETAPHQPDETGAAVPHEAAVVGEAAPSPPSVETGPEPVGAEPVESEAVASPPRPGTADAGEAPVLNGQATAPAEFVPPAASTSPPAPAERLAERLADGALPAVAQAAASQTAPSQIAPAQAESGSPSVEGAPAGQSSPQDALRQLQQQMKGVHPDQVKAQLFQGQARLQTQTQAQIPPEGQGRHEAAGGVSPPRPPVGEPVPVPAQSRPPLPGQGQHGQGRHDQGQPSPSSHMPPPAMPFPAGQTPANRISQAAASTSDPLPVSRSDDAEIAPPKVSSSKIALMISGVVGAVGIGIGAAQYLNQSGETDKAVPVVKSEAKLAAKQAAGAAQSLASPEMPTPASAGRDRAYKIGMTHLVKGEFATAIPYLEQAEALGHAEAGYNLASLYAKGDGVEQDFKKAVAYLRKSADRGYYPAMTNLGLLYAQGQGVEQNYLTARSLWLKAAAGEHPDAMHNLAVIYATGKGVDKDMEEAVKWYRKGANAGYVDSIANLGLIYANGDGVERDFSEAKRLWEAAAAKGHKVAAQNLEKLKQVMAQQ